MPPPLPKNTFQSVFPKGLDKLVKATNIRLKNEQVVRILLDCIAINEDINLYKNLPMTKMLACQDQIFYEVKLLHQNIKILSI